MSPEDSEERPRNPRGRQEELEALTRRADAYDEVAAANEALKRWSERGLTVTEEVRRVYYATGGND